MQYSDDPKGPVGANCYACHQLTKAEVSFGTIGPPLYNFVGEGKACVKGIVCAGAIGVEFATVWSSYGVDVTIGARFGQGGQVQGGLATGRTVTDNCGPSA